MSLIRCFVYLHTLRLCESSFWRIHGCGGWGNWSSLDGWRFCRQTLCPPWSGRHICCRLFFEPLPPSPHHQSENWDRHKKSSWVRECRGTFCSLCRVGKSLFRGASYSRSQNIRWLHRGFCASVWIKWCDVFFDGWVTTHCIASLILIMIEYYT